jgi:hypothetical protein
MNCSKCQKFKSCEHYSDYSCQHYIEKVNKPMAENKVIFESEEEFAKTCKDIFGITVQSKDVVKAKELGYILKSAVEEAEEIINKKIFEMDVDEVDFCELSFISIKKIYKAIQELKAENNEFKNRENQSIKRD